MMQRILQVCFIICAVFGDCVTEAIVGGAVVQPANRYPAFTWSGIKDGGWGCGGVLIHSDIVLTAGHCQWVYYDSASVFVNPQSINGTIDGIAPMNMTTSNSKMKTKNDELKSLLRGEAHVVESSLVHPNFGVVAKDVTGSFDIMIVKLTSSSLITPFRYNTDHHIPTVGDKLTTIGFGTTSEDGRDGFSTLLREVAVSAIDYEHCNKTYAASTGLNVVDDTTQLCGGTARGGRDACDSDSGSPLLVGGDTVVGIVDDGIGCGRPNIPSINARVSGFDSWISMAICVFSHSPPKSCSSTLSGMSFNESMTMLSTPTTTVGVTDKTSSHDERQHKIILIVGCIGGIVLLAGSVFILHQIHRRFGYNEIPN